MTSNERHLSLWHYFASIRCPIVLVIEVASIDHAIALLVKPPGLFMRVIEQMRRNSCQDFPLNGLFAIPCYCDCTIQIAGLNESTH